MEGILIMGGFIAAVFWIGLTIAAFFQVGWFYSILMIALTVGILFLISAIYKKADNQPQKEKARTITKISIGLSVAMIIIGFLMFIFCFLLGPTGYVDTFTECGLCGGSGIAFGKVCSLCHGNGGASGSDARYTAESYTWLGVLIASSGVAIILGTRSIKKKCTSKKGNPADSTPDKVAKSTLPDNYKNPANYTIRVKLLGTSQVEDSDQTNLSNEKYIFTDDKTGALLGDGTRGQILYLHIEKPTKIKCHVGCGFDDGILYYYNPRNNAMYNVILNQQTSEVEFVPTSSF